MTDLERFLQLIDETDFSCNSTLYGIKDNIEQIKKLFEAAEKKSDLFYFFKRQSSQALIEYHLYDCNSIYKKRYSFFEFLCGNFHISFFAELSETAIWKQVFDRITQGDLDSGLTFLKMPSREKTIAEILKTPYMKQFNISVKNGSAVLERETERKIVRDIETLIDKLGAENIIDSLFAYLSNQCYDTNIGRYEMPRRIPNGVEEIKIHDPYNYLISLCLKHFNYPARKAKYKEQRFLKLLLITRNFVFLYDLQVTSKYGDLLFPNAYNKDMFYKIFLADNIYRFKQGTSKFFTRVIYNLLATQNSEEVDKRLGFPLNNYLEFVERIFKNRFNGKIGFNEEMLSETERKICEAICHKGTVNENLTTPKTFGMSANPFGNKPLLKKNNAYYLIDKNYCAWNFYEFVLQKIDYDKKLIDVGKNLENLINNAARNVGLIIHFGKYDGSDRECDLVIEETGSIIFVEMKKKTLTNKSLSGDKIQIAIDLCESFLDTQEQMAEHETFLMQNKHIVFKNGATLDFNDRNIIRISLTLFDLYSFNEHYFSMAALDYLKTIQFNFKESVKKKDKHYDEVEKNIKTRNKKIKGLNDRISNLEKNFGIDLRTNKFDGWFLNVEFLLFLFREIKRTKKPLSELLKSMRNITYNTGDVFYEYKQAMSLMNYGK